MKLQPRPLLKTFPTVKKLSLFAALFVSLSAAIFFATRERMSRAPRGFVTTRGARFIVDDETFRFTGANVAVMFRDEDRARMPDTLQEAAREGLGVIRVWASGEGGEDSSVKSVGGDARDWPRKHPFRFSPGQWNEEAFVFLDKVIAEARRNNLRVQLCLTNWWRDTGGVTQYLRWVGVNDAADDTKPFGINVERAMLFYTNEDARKLYREHVERIVTRRNSITGVLYRDDPTIMGYELMNEAQAATGRWQERRAWIAEMSGYIKSLDPYHLIAPGTWGYRTSWERREWLLDHQLPNIDYCDVHNYPRDDLDSFVDSPASLREFIENRASAAFSIKKPLVFGEFGMGPEGYQGFSEIEWFRAYFDAARESGIGGALYWILTPDAQRGYGISYTTPRDEQLRAEIHRASELFVEHRDDAPPARVLDFDRHLIPRQFAFTRAANDPLIQPEVSVIKTSNGVINLYRFKPESAAKARFEKMGGGEGYIWGYGVGFVEYIVPAREGFRNVKSVVVRAHIQPVLPPDAPAQLRQTRVTLIINGTDCGSRLIPVEQPPNALVQEWNVDSLLVRLSASRGKPLSVRFVVRVDADRPFGLNISNWPEGYNAHDSKPVEVEVR